MQKYIYPYTLEVTKSKSTIKRIGNFTKSAISCRFGNRVYTHTHTSPNNSKKQTVNHCFKATFVFSKKPTASQTYPKFVFFDALTNISNKKNNNNNNSKKTQLATSSQTLRPFLLFFYGTSKPCCSIGVSCSKPALRHLNWVVCFFFGISWGIFFEMKKIIPKNEHAENRSF